MPATLAATPVLTRSQPLSTSQLRDGAMSAASQGRFDEARGLLESALARDPAQKLELMSDLAAIAWRAGDLVQSIALSRHVAAKLPAHDEARFTLAMSLSAIGSHGEALELLDSLGHGERGARFHSTQPQLAALAATEAARLHPLRPAAIGTGMKTGAVAALTTPHKYDFSHLVQPLDQTVGGPVQDDEALLLYAVVRTMRLRRVLELGGLSGYSARNFLAALSWDVDTAVYSVDLNPVPSLAPNHFTICKDAALIEAADVHARPLDLVFFDCHVYDAQIALFVRLVQSGLITDATIIALHDTNLHPKKFADWCYPIQDADGSTGFVHQPVERRMVNALRKELGYDVFCAHPDLARHDARLPYRHGLTLMKKFSELRT